MNPRYRRDGDPRPGPARGGLRLLRGGLRGLARGGRRLWRATGSATRVAYLWLAYDNVHVNLRTYLGPGCDIHADAGARIELAGVHIGRGCRIVAGPGAVIDLHPGGIIQPYTTLAARERITLGEGSGIGELSMVRDSNHVRDPGVPFIDGPHVTTPVDIGRRVWVGGQVTILRGVVIGDDATVAAGSVVTRSVPAGTLVGGVPAVPLHPAPVPVAPSRSSRSVEVP